MDDQLPRAFDSARPPEFGELRQPTDLGRDALIQLSSGAWVFSFDIVENPVAILQGGLRLFEPLAQALAALPSAFARRFSKWASTSA